MISSTTCADTLKLIKKNNRIKSIDEVYSLLGISRHQIYKWQKNSTSTQTKKMFKHLTFVAAGEVFGLSSEETEALANKAGLTLHPIGNFVEIFGGMLDAYPKSKRHLCEVSFVSDRMFRYIKEGQYSKKGAVLALSISMGQSLDNIQTLLKSAGYVLSESLPNDAVILWILRHTNQPHDGRVFQINEVLNSLGLPLLMTREQRENE